MSTDGKMGESDESGNGPPPKIESSNEEVKEVNWSMEFQDKSPLVNLKNEQCLLLFFSYLSLADGFRLSTTCRRLYYYFKESCKVRKSLVLTEGSNTLAYNIEEMFAVDGVLDEDQFNKRLPLSSVYISSDGKDGYNLSLAVVQQLLASLPNLTYLEIVGNIKRADFCSFITTLNTLQQLETLKLYLRISDKWQLEKETTTAEKESTSEKNLSAYPPLLQLPSLKHLTMCMEGGLIIGACFIPNSKDEMSQSSIISQLSTFHLWSTNSIPNPCYFISKYVRPNAQLVAGSSAVMISVYFKPNQAKDYLENVEALAYITNLQVDELPSDDNFKKMLSSMVNLRDFSFQFGDKMKVNDYPALLTALSKLPHLKTISANLIDPLISGTYISEGHRWPLSAMPVLPSVTKLSIQYYTAMHDDVVDQFHLKHCFPELKLLQCTFDFSHCQYGHIEEIDDDDMTSDYLAEKGFYIFGRDIPDLNTVRLSCALKLTIGMKDLPAKKDISFFFEDGDTSYLLYDEENNTVFLASDKAK